MARWRDIKHKRVENSSTISEPSTINNYSQNVGFLPRFKALVVDMFMIYMPMLYIITYIVLGDSQTFRESDLAPFSAILIYALVSTIFVHKKGQTPGKKAYDIKIVDESSKENLSIIKSFIRFILFIVSASTIVGIALTFFRDDKKTFHDLVVGSIVIRDEN